MNRFFTFFCFLAILVGCQQLEDAPPLKRNTFLRFYERSTNYKGQALQVLPDGLLFAGDVQQGLSLNTVITRTDAQGNILWETQIDSATTNSVLAVADGYLVFGASIKVNPQAEQVSDVIKNTGFIAKLDLSSGAVVKKHAISKYFLDRTNAVNSRTNFIGDALILDAGGNIYGLGQIRPPSAAGNAEAFVVGINPSTLDTLWFKNYAFANRDYVNAKSTYVNNEGKIVWASSAKTTSGAKSYLSIPVVTANSTFVNSSPFGSLEDKFYSGEDITPTAVGYGVIGTYYNTQSASSNIFFVQTNSQGGFIPNSERFFDGVVIAGTKKELTDRDQSSTEDSGDAITVTKDSGYLLAGSMVTTPERGNGGKDIILIRLDAFGGVVWNKILGGAGDETVRKIQLSADGGYTLCGTSTISGLSSVFIMKLDQNGDLID